MITFRKSAFALAAILAGAVFAASTPAMAGIRVGCDVGTLSGVYTYAYTGFNVVSGVDVPFSTSGFASYNGAGALVGRETTTTTVNGRVAVSVSNYTGTYTITPNCIIKEIDKDPSGALSHYDEYTGPSGNTINFVETDQGVVSAAVETRD